MNWLKSLLVLTIHVWGPESITILETNTANQKPALYMAMAEEDVKSVVAYRKLKSILVLSIHACLKVNTTCSVIHTLALLALHVQYTHMATDDSSS